MMNPSAILDLISNLWLQLHEAQAEIERLKAERNGQGDDTDVRDFAGSKAR